jgi:NAD+ diphosphatase
MMGRVTAYVPGASATAEPSPTDAAIGVLGTDVLLRPGLELASVQDFPAPADICPLGTLDGRPLWAVSPSWPDADPGSLVRSDWISLAATAGPDLTHVGARAVQTIGWRAQHRYCGACRTLLEELPYPGRTCPACGVNVFITSHPVVLVAVLRDAAHGPEVLLARHTYRDTRSWLLIGGWVDPAETLEAGAAREAAEEAGIAVTDLRYWGSEAWGLDGPGVLITAFTARPVDPTAEPRPDLHELSDARYFPLSDLPAPRAPAHHISGRLLDELTATAVG